MNEVRDYPGIWEDDDDTWDDDSAETRNEAQTEPEQHWSRMKNVPQPKNDLLDMGTLERVWMSFWVAVFLSSPVVAVLLLFGKFEWSLVAFLFYWWFVADSNSPRRLR